MSFNYGISKSLSTIEGPEELRGHYKEATIKFSEVAATNVQCSFDGSSLEATVFKNCVFKGAVFLRSNVSNIRLINCKIISLTFIKCEMNSVIFENCYGVENVKIIQPKNMTVAPVKTVKGDNETYYLIRNNSYFDPTVIPKGPYIFSKFPGVQSIYDKVSGVVQDYFNTKETVKPDKRAYLYTSNNKDF